MTDYDIIPTTNISLLKKDRLKSLLESSDFSDCTFIIDNDEIRAHKLLLACSSPVFEKMFYGELASDRVVITDITKKHFTEMLRFVYTNDVTFTSVIHAWSLFYIANKYLLGDFCKLCTTYVEKNLTISNLALNYEFSEMYGITSLQKKCMNDIVDFVKAILHCDYHMKISTLVSILEQPALNISSSDLVIGVLHWAVIECGIQNINLDAQSVINYLKSSELLKFLIKLEFDTDHPDILFQNTLKLINSIQFEQPISSFKTYSMKHWCIFCKIRESYKIAGRLYLRENQFLSLEISVNRKILLYGLVLRTEDEPVGSFSNIYKATITVRIEDKNLEPISVTVCTKNVPYDTPVYVALNDLVWLDCDQSYRVSIGYSNLDNLSAKNRKERTILCNHMSNKLIEEKKKIVFSFKEHIGSPVQGICYYPA